jgi:predicted lipoprotein with Yx(FWY)xxD motif
MPSLLPLRPSAARRVVTVSALMLCAVAVTAGCGKTITIGSAKPAATTAAAAPAATTAAAAATTAAAAGGNDQLELVGSSAAQNGKTGTGGTVVGLTVQETPPEWVQLSAVTSPPLNAPHLININQAALYRFDTDTAKPSQSNCNDACAVKWPPVTIKQGGAVYLAGVHPKEVGAIRRQDGNIQLTIGGHPIYRFSGDSKPGDLNGQGVGGTWFAVGPKGEKVTATQ